MISVLSLPCMFMRLMVGCGIGICLDVVPEPDHSLPWFLVNLISENPETLS